MIEKLRRYHDRTMASFFIDDVCGHSAAGAEAFRRFSAWAGQSGLRGECSAILAYGRDAQERALPLHRDYVAEVDRAGRTHLDAHMEIMTHRYLYDFAADRMRDAWPHEGVWLIDRSRSQDEYHDYFDRILHRGEQAGFRHAGLTLPGCGCEPCQGLKRSLGIRSVGAADLNRHVLAALLELASAGRFTTPTPSLFIGHYGQGPMDAQVMLEDRGFGVYDLPPGVAGDTLARWDNLPQYLDLDAYITADGAAGRLAELVALRSDTLVWYGHWQGVRPDTGIAWGALQELGSRLNRHHGDRIVWMRPTEIAMYRHTERHTQVRVDGDGRHFTLSIPFAPLHPLSFRLRGSASARVRTPTGQTLAPWRCWPSEACAIFDILPENGRYEVLT